MNLIMRVVEATQTQLGDLPIGDIKFNIKSRDDIPQLLRGLQFIYTNQPLRQRVFDLLEKNIQPDSDHNNGRPGMNLWSILVMDAMRKVITLTGRLSEDQGLSGWRQYRYNIRQIKKYQRIAQLSKRGGGKTEAAKEKKQAKIVEVHQQYLDWSQYFLDKSEETLKTLRSKGPISLVKNLRAIEIEQYKRHANRQIDQIRRRVMAGETIPHAEKVFSIFQPHTEWIVKGKAGINQELGLRVCIIEDQYRFLLHHQVMEKQTDNQVGVSIVEEAKARFSDLSSCSFDKGFHSPDNQIQLAGILDSVALPHKGKPSKKVRGKESSVDYKKAHDKHSAVESAINALEVHGLNRCPDHGIDGFKRYVGLSIVARNVQRIGAILTDQERSLIERQERKRLKQAA